MKKIDDRVMLEMVGQGRLQTEISERFGVSPAAVCKRLKRLRSIQEPPGFQNLTTKEKRFTIGIMEGKSQTDSAMTAFDCTSRESGKAVGHQLMQKNDIKRAIELGVDQITTYPLFTFPYSTVGKYLKLKSVKMPGIVTRRRMYKAIHDYCVANGFRRVSVWGFKRGDLPRYSSVTRESYIGLGAGAASYLPGVFYFNTFSVSEYIKASLAQRLPVALKMEVSESMAMYYWLYWRFYDTYIPKRRLRELFGSRDKKIRRLLVLAKALGLCVQDEEHISLTERGAFWLHLMQNYFILNYINKVWSLAMKEPWPERVEI